MIKMHNWRSGCVGKRGAFTLVEVLFVVALLGILALLAVPGAGDIEQDRLRSAARLLLADIEFAQIRSMENGSDPCVITFDTVTKSYSIAAQSAPSTPLLDPLSHAGYSTKFGFGRAAAISGVTLESVQSMANSRVVFNGFGALQQTSTPIIILRAGSRTLQISIDPSTGEAAVQ